MKRLLAVALFLLLSAAYFSALAEGGCAHSWSVVSSIPASCTTEGTEIKKCSQCGAETSSSLPRQAHNYADAQWSQQSPASCTSPGLNIRVCILCGGNPAYKEIPATGHAWQTSTQAASCTQAGSITKKCTNCSETQTDSIPAKGHSEVKDSGRAATCTSGGLSDGKHCSVCGTVTQAQQSTSALGHRMTRISGTSPTCTEPGKADGEKCAHCGYTIAGASIPATGHKSKGDGNAKAPTCTEKGLTESKHCTICGITVSGRKTIAAKGHQEVTDAAQAPSFQESGRTAGVHCTACGKVLTEQEIIPALNEFEAARQLAERMNGQGSFDSATASFPCEGNMMEIILPQPNEQILTGIAATPARSLTAFRITTHFSETPIPDWKTILSTENAMAALKADENYGGFVQTAQALLMALDVMQTAEEADAWLNAIFPHITETGEDLAAVFAAFAGADQHVPVQAMESKGYVYHFVTDGMNISLMIRSTDP